MKKLLKTLATLLSITALVPYLSPVEAGRGSTKSPEKGSTCNKRLRQEELTQQEEKELQRHSKRPEQSVLSPTEEEKSSSEMPNSSSENLESHQENYDSGYEGDKEESEEESKKESKKESEEESKKRKQRIKQRRKQKNKEKKESEEESEEEDPYLETIKVWESILYISDHSPFDFTFTMQGGLVTREEVEREVRGKQRSIKFLKNELFPKRQLCSPELFEILFLVKDLIDIYDITHHLSLSDIPILFGTVDPEMPDTFIEANFVRVLFYRKKLTITFLLNDVPVREYTVTAN